MNVWTGEVRDMARGRLRVWSGYSVIGGQVAPLVGIERRKYRDRKGEGVALMTLDQARRLHDRLGAEIEKAEADHLAAF